MSPARKLTKTSDKNIYLDEESGIFIWRERIDGVNHWRSTDEKTISAARTKVKKFRMDASGGPRVKTRHTFGEAFDILLAVQKPKSRKTFEQTLNQVGHLRPWFMGDPERGLEPGCTYLSDFEREFEEVWARYKTDQAKLTPGRKLEHDRRYLLMALKRAKARGWVTRVFTKADLQLSEATEPVGRIIRDDELAKLLPEVEKNSTLYAQVMLALLMGMRLREVLHLRWEEVDLKNRFIHIGGQRVKTRYGRAVPIHNLVQPILVELKKNAQGPYVFPARHMSIEGQPFDYGRPQDDNSKSWERAKEDSGVKARFHDLRHTAISFMVIEGVPDMIISKITGASLEVIRRVYLHLNLDVTEKVRNLRCANFVRENEK